MTNDSATAAQVAQIARANAGIRATDARRPGARTADDEGRKRTPTASERQVAAVLGRDLDDDDDE